MCSCDGSGVEDTVLEGRMSSQEFTLGDTLCVSVLVIGSTVEVLPAAVVTIPGQLTTVLLPVMRYTGNVDNTLFKHIFVNL